MVVESSNHTVRVNDVSCEVRRATFCVEEREVESSFHPEIFSRDRGWVGENFEVKFLGDVIYAQVVVGPGEVVFDFLCKGRSDGMRLGSAERGILVQEREGLDDRLVSVEEAPVHRVHEGRHAEAEVDQRVVRPLVDGLAVFRDGQAKVSRDQAVVCDHHLRGEVVRMYVHQPDEVSLRCIVEIQPGA